MVEVIDVPAVLQPNWGSESDATGTTKYVDYVLTVCVQIKKDEDGGLPLRDKLLILSAPYRSPLSQKEFLKTIYSCFFYLPILINIEPMIPFFVRNFTSSSPKMPDSHLFLCYNDSCHS